MEIVENNLENFIINCFVRQFAQQALYQNAKTEKVCSQEITCGVRACCVTLQKDIKKIIKNFSTQRMKILWKT